MKRYYIIIATLPLSMFSCTTYKHVTVESSELRRENHEFISETDSINIRYSFEGYDSPVRISIHNKSEKPLYVDWKKSAMVANGRTYSYWIDHSSIKLHTTSFTNSQIDHVSKGSIVKDERIDFIPPNSYIESKRTDLYDLLVDLPESNLQNQKMITPNGNKVVQRYMFNQDDSPLNIRSIINLSSTESFHNETNIESNFWVSEVIVTDQRKLYSFDEPNDYSKKNNKSTNKGVFLSIFSMFLIVLVIAGTSG